MIPKELIKMLEKIEQIDFDTIENEEVFSNRIKFDELQENIKRLTKEQAEIYKKISSLYLKFCINSNQFQQNQTRLNSMMGFDLEPE
tara:strand:- start:38 stop:298 length:261 start_codon:yes stop_codon:yes gene_type:complete